MSSRALKFQTPLSVLKSFFPNARIFSKLDLRVFGCSIYVHLHDVNRSKLDPRSCKCVFLGYSTLQSFQKQKYFIPHMCRFLKISFVSPQSSLKGRFSRIWLLIQIFGKTV